MKKSNITKTMPFLGAAALLCCASLHGAPITWGAATTLVDSTDVVTTGTLVQSYTGDNQQGDMTLNGVTFLQGRLPGASGGGDLNANAANTGDADYDNFIDLYSFNIGSTGSTGTITLSGLVDGQDYLVQIWNADARNDATYLRNKNTKLDDGNGNTVTLLGTVDATATGLGQWVTGTFTASGTTWAAIYSPADLTNSLGIFHRSQVDWKFHPGGGDDEGQTRTVHHSGEPKYAIRKGAWVLIDSPDGDCNGWSGGEPDWFKKERGYPKDEQPGQLYNVHDDLSERKNHFVEHPELVHELKQLLEKYRNDGRSTPGEPQMNDAPAAVSIAKPKALTKPVSESN